MTLLTGQTRIVLVQLGGEFVSGLPAAVFDPFVPTWAPASLVVVSFAAGACVAFGR